MELPRRRFLARLAPAAGAVTGCIGRPSSRSRTETPTGTDGPPLRAELDALQPAVFSLSVDYYSMTAAPDAQYLFVKLALRADPPPAPDEFAFRFDGEAHPPLDPELPRRGIDTPRYDNGRGWLLFEFPETGDPSGAALTSPAGTWRPGAELRSRLEAPFPALSVDWSAPERLQNGATPTFAFEVSNDGDRAGRFVAVLNGEAGLHWPVAVISRFLPAGTRDAWTVEGAEVALPGEFLEDDGAALDIELIHPGGEGHRSIQVVKA